MDRARLGCSPRALVRRATSHLLLVACLSLVVAGCGGSGETARLQGTVTLNGQPLPDGLEAPTISFSPVQRGKIKGTAAPIVDGQYDAQDVPKGEVRVYFQLSQWTGQMIQEGRGTPYKEMKDILPVKYAAGMVITVDGNDSKLNFDLTEEGSL